MLLSDAIDTGSKLIPHHRGATFSRENCAACALGMAIVGATGSFDAAKKYWRENNGTIPSLINLGILPKENQYLFYDGIRDTVANTVIVMNDNDGKSPEEIARFLRVNGF